MKYSYTAKKRIRKNFGKLSDVLPIPNLIELQVTSYNQFLERDNLNNQKSGLHKVFESVFPIYDYSNNMGQSNIVTVMVPSGIEILPTLLEPELSEIINTSIGTKK